MKNQSLTGLLVRELHLPKAKVSKMQTKVIGAIVKALQEGQIVTVPGLCRIELKTRAAHIGRNPFTKTTVEVPEKKLVKIHTATSLNKKLNKK